MNILTKILLFPVSRRRVESNMIENFIDMLKSDLEVRGFLDAKALPGNLMMRLVEEAYSRAAMTETDGRARYGKMYRELERVAVDLVLLQGNPTTGNPALQAILSHHGYEVGKGMGET